jgi:hypothetical protein
MILGLWEKGLVDKRGPAKEMAMLSCPSKKFRATGMVPCAKLGMDGGAFVYVVVV